jgi:uncharacterized SAM-binding protein YcdF (DUF218 family)
MRLVAVLGYSARRSDGLHPVCAERLSCAEQAAGDADAVLLSGWARRQDAAGEVELMRHAWRGPEVALLSDTKARNTVQNALGVAAAAQQVGAREVVVVTSRWHAFRARTLVRAALREPGVSVLSSSPSGRAPVSLLARELGCLAALPVQLFRLRRSEARSASVGAQ